MAIRFAKLGCQLVLWDVNDDGNRETAAECETLGARANVYSCDVSKPEVVNRVASKVTKPRRSTRMCSLYMAI